MWAKRFSFDRCFGEEDSDNGEGQEKVGENMAGTARAGDRLSRNRRLLTFGAVHSRPLVFISLRPTCGGDSQELCRVLQSK